MKQLPPRHSRVVGTGSCLPPRRLTNADLVRQLAARGIDTSDEWIVERTGIRARHFAADGVAASDLAVTAARHAIEAAGLRSDDIDLIILGTDSPDYITPATSVVVQEKLGAKNAGTFDVGCACASFPTGFATASGLIAANPACIVGSTLTSYASGTREQP